MKIFLSPSNQTENKYTGLNTNEAEVCGKIGAACYDALKRNGFDVMLQQYDSMQNRCVASNKYDADLHVCIHTNSFNGKVSGTRMFCYSTSGEGMKACKAIFNVLAPFTPGTSENIQVNKELYEVRVPSAPTAYIEVDFHDVPSVAKWLAEHTTEIGEKICEGICHYFNVEYKTVRKTTTLYRVQVGAYSLKANAERMLDKLLKAGFQGFITTVTKED